MSGDHKLVLDIQRTARKNMLAYQKKVNDVLKGVGTHCLRIELREIFHRYTIYSRYLIVGESDGLAENRIAVQYLLKRRKF